MAKCRQPNPKFIDGIVVPFLSSSNFVIGLGGASTKRVSICRQPEPEPDPKIYQCKMMRNSFATLDKLLNFGKQTGRDAFCGVKLACVLGTSASTVNQTTLNNSLTLTHLHLFELIKLNVEELYNGISFKYTLHFVIAIKAFR